MIQQPITLGVFPTVALKGDRVYLAYREGDPRTPGVLYAVMSPMHTWAPSLLFQQALPAGSPCFPKLHVFGDEVWLGHHDGTNLWLQNLTRAEGQEFDGFGNDPCTFGGRWFAWQSTPGYSVSRLDLLSGERSDHVRGGAPTGLSRVTNEGTIVTIDEDRFALPGATIPSFAHHVTVGEGSTGGCAWWHAPNLRGVIWPGQDCFTPKVAATLTHVAIATHGPDVRLFVGTRDDLKGFVQPHPPPPPPDPDPPDPPEPEPTPMRLTDAQFQSLKAERDALHKDVLTKEEGGALLNRWAWKHRNDPNRVGLERDESDPKAIMPDGTPIWAGARIIVDGKHYGGDVVVAAAVGRFEPNNPEFFPANATGPNGRVEPIDPGGVTPPPPPPPDPEPEYATKAYVDRLVGDSESRILEALVHQFPHIAARFQALEDKIDVLPTPGPAPLPPDVVRESTHKGTGSVTFGLWTRTVDVELVKK